MTGALDVALAFDPARRVRVGRLALDGNTAVFQYDPAFIATGLSINPALGPPEVNLVRPRNPRAFRGLHGVFADSLPEAWGELLLERRLRHAGMSSTSLTVLDRLALIGRHGRGALTYEPARDEDLTVDVDLDRLAREAAEVLEGHESAVLRELERLGGSSGGARPKVQVALDAAGHARSDDGRPLPAGFNSWIVKFRGSVDRADIGPLEAAYAEAARRAGIEMPRTRLIAAKRGPGYFATERFDRGPAGTRLHMLSVAGLLDEDWTIPSLSYEALLTTVRRVTRDETQVEEMYRRLVFNVLAHNRDDHIKQHAFLLDASGRWRLSPAYDVTFAAGPGNEHYLTVNGKGHDIERADLLAVASTQTIDARRAEGTIAEVGAVVASLPSVAADFGSTRATLRELKRAIEAQLAGYKAAL